MPSKNTHKQDSLRILYVGDIYAEPGMRIVEELLPSIRREQQIDLVIAQGENVSAGRGMLPTDMRRLQGAGVDFFTGGNWSLHHPELTPLLEDEQEPVIRPANYPAGTSGKGFKYVNTPKGKVLVISLLGKIVGKDAKNLVDNPLQVVDQILEAEKHKQRVATVMNFHGDYSSEKVIVGYYLDGKVSAVIGDHWHVPTADAMVLPGGTAHISDVGMCGALHSSLGVKLASVIRRWKDGALTKNEIENNGPLQFNGVIIDVDISSGLSRDIESVNKQKKM